VFPSAGIPFGSGKFSLLLLFRASSINTFTINKMNFRDFKDKFEKIPVEHCPSQTPETPLVSVCVMTYNQADYIEDCLEGILMQKTDFPVEILLGEDGSSDGTRKICIDYANKYPDKIRLFLHHRENNIKINGKQTGRFNFLYNFYAAKGKYIALCDGDDYWTDHLKLQKASGFHESK
jgi:cellulose synthase/poly-beta-1,6-N-acetylglucosamine synthase-like glycosyltransferase